MSAFLFIVVIDWLMKNVTEQQRTGIRWTFCTKLEDLEFADEIALPSHTRAHMQQKSVRLNDIANTIGLKINVGKQKSCLMTLTRNPSRSTTKHLSL